MLKSSLTSPPGSTLLVQDQTSNLLITSRFLWPPPSFVDMQYLWNIIFSKILDQLHSHKDGTSLMFTSKLLKFVSPTITMQKSEYNVPQFVLMKIVLLFAQCNYCIGSTDMKQQVYYDFLPFHEIWFKNLWTHNYKILHIAWMEIAPAQWCSTGSCLWLFYHPLVPKFAGEMYLFSWN